MSFWKTILSATCKPSFCQFVDHFFLFERETPTLMYLSKNIQARPNMIPFMIFYDSFIFCSTRHWPNYGTLLFMIHDGQAYIPQNT